MRRLKGFVRAAICVICGAAAVPCLADEPVKADESAVIPEVYVTSTNYCVVRVDLKGSEPERRKRVLDFMGSAYDESEHWSAGYIVAGVDYIDFSYLRIVYSPCNVDSRTVSTAARLLCAANGDSNTPRCDGSDLRVVVEPNSQLVTEYKGPELPIFLFEYFRGKQALRACTVRIPNEQWPDEWIQTHNYLVHLIVRYRMPLIDVYPINKDFYLLFSNNCEQKAVLLQRAKELLKVEDFDWDKYLGEPDLNPDVSEYRYRQTGGNKPIR